MPDPLITANYTPFGSITTDPNNGPLFYTAAKFAALSSAVRLSYVGRTVIDSASPYSVLGVVDGGGNLNPGTTGFAPSLASLSGYGPGFINTEGQILCDPADPAALTLATWTNGTGTLASSRDVTWKGRPTLKISTLAATTRIEVGNTSGIVLPSRGTGRSLYLFMWVTEQRSPQAHRPTLETLHTQTITS